VAGVIFPDSDSAPVAKFLKPARNFFKSENLTLVQTPTTIGATEIEQRFTNSSTILLLLKINIDSGSVFSHIFDSGTGPKKREQKRNKINQEFKLNNT